MRSPTLLRAAIKTLATELPSAYQELMADVDFEVARRSIQGAAVLSKPPFEPFDKQRPFMVSLAATNLISGAVRAGKSRPLVERALADALAYPGIRIGVFRKVRATMLETTIRSFLVDANGWASVDDEAGSHGLIKRWRKSELKATLYNGSEFLFYGMDRLSKVGSLEIGKAYIDEASELTEDDFQMIETRRGQIGSWKPQTFMATNPGAPNHWINSRIMSGGAVDTLVISLNSFDNPHTSDEYKSQLRRLTGIFYRRMVLGEWVGFAGVIYDCFDANIHIVGEAPNGPAAINIRAIDFGGINPNVCLWIREMPDGKLYIYREIYYSGISAQRFAEMINDAQPDDEPIRITISDHDASDRYALFDSGIPTKPAKKDVMLGIQKTYEKLANNELFFVDGGLVEADDKMLDTSGLIGRKRPQRLIEEIPAYEWSVGAGGIARDEPRKIDDHGLDALRYGIMGLLSLKVRRTRKATGL